ncbi:hypothetical protein V6M85_11740 [Sulfolobus tengchongensis]|uniref:Uncharacterized protein n=1 Tax=Sulfolobus tengchongensis TaxID=207809 RepID=A0AAX4KZS8_9CREN
MYKREHDIIADVANNLQDLGKELDIVLEALDYLSNAWNIARYQFLNGNEVVEPEEYISEDMCKEGIR